MRFSGYQHIGQGRDGSEPAQIQFQLKLRSTRGGMTEVDKMVPGVENADTETLGSLSDNTKAQRTQIP